MGNKNSQEVFPPADYMTKKYATKKQDKSFYKETDSGKTKIILLIISIIVATMIGTGDDCDFFSMMVEDEK